LMREDKKTLELPGRGGWSAEAVNFVEATSLVSLDELSYVSTDSSRGETLLRSIIQHEFVTGSNRPKTLTALCFVSNLSVERECYLKGAFSEKLGEPARRDQPVG
jgi:hypothetical protein